MNRSRRLGTGKFTFTLSSVVGPGKMFVHGGLLSSGNKPEFVFVLGGTDYFTNGKAMITGVTAGTKAAGAGSWSPATVTTSATDGNAYITVP